MKKVHFAAVVGFLCLATSCTLVPGTRISGPDEPSSSRLALFQLHRATGVALPSAQELQRLRSQMRTVVKVHPNGLWLARLSGPTPTDQSAPTKSIGTEIDTVPTSEFEGINPSVGDAALPKQVNNALLAAFPPIGDQGGIGSCAAFSTTYYTLTHEVGLKYQINNKGGLGSAGNRIFSPKWTYNLINGGGDYGSWMPSINELVGQVGCATWDEFPYIGDGSNPANYLQWATDAPIWMDAMRFRIPSQGTIPITDSLAEIKGYLANGHVVTFATGVYSWHYQNIGDNPASTLDQPYVGKSAMIYVDSQNGGGHSMTVTGYNDDVWVDINNDGVVQSQELGVLIVANSWGTGFLDNGFVYVTYDSLRPQSTAGLPVPIADRMPAFWNSEFYYIEVQKYDPSVVASFTLNQEQRNQIYVTYSLPSGITYNTPFRYTGGAYSFAGTATPTDGTFLLDVSSLIPTSASTMNLQIQDGYLGFPTTVKAISLFDVASSTAYPIGSLPQTVDNMSATYTLSETTPGPTPTPGPSPDPSHTWTLGATYSVGEIVTYHGASYRCLIAHTAYAPDWNPEMAPSLWVKI